MDESAAAGAGLVVLLVYVALIVVMIAAGWKVFVKAGQPGWAILIPIFNIYVLMQVAGKPGWWIILMLIPLVNLVISILVVIGVAENFGKGIGFAAGLFLLPFIFYPILAFGDAEYQG